MKTRLFWLGFGTSLGVLALHSGVSVLIWWYASSDPDVSDIVGLIIWLFILDIMVAACIVSIGLGYIFRPIGAITRQAAIGEKADTNYPELKPIIDMLNSRSEESDKQYEELLEDKKFMERAKKSKDEFIANITHEMNTPLTSIIGYAELLKGGGLPPGQQEKALTTIMKQSERLHGMISCVINYNEIDNDSLPPYEVNISELTEELLTAIKPHIEKRKLTLTTDITPGIIIDSRVERINQVLGNIISNAVRYNKEGGALDVKLTADGGKITAAVSDTGIGLTQKELGKIFDRFYTVDKSHNGIGGGYGLGLATVKKICKKSGWIISVASKPDEGTTFTVVFK